MAEIMKRYRVANPGKAKRKARGEAKYITSWLGMAREQKEGYDAKANYKIKARSKRRAASQALTPHARSYNPGTRKLTLKQKLHFGTARQRAAARAAMSGKRKRMGNPSRSTSAKSSRGRVNSIYRKQGMGAGFKFDDYAAPKAKYKRASSAARGRLQKAPAFRTGNPASIITLTNPGTTRKRTNTTMAKKRVYRRTRRAGVRRRRNPGLSLMQAGRPARRRMSASRRTRNAGVLSGGFNSAFGIIGGGVLTSLISSKLPAGLNTGVLGYVSTAAVAIAQGTVAGKVFKNPALGKSMTIGGFVYLALRLVQDFVPSLSLPFKLGAIANSSFYTPQVPMGNSMTSFMTPPGVQQAIMGAMPMAGAGGMGRVGRVGRVR